MRAGLRSAAWGILGVGLALSLALVVFGWWVLESSGVAVIETTRADGRTRSTHVWYVTRDGELWLEAGTPQNGWYVDVQNSPLVRIDLGDRSLLRRALPVPDRAVHRELRSLLRAKYGVRDQIVGWFVDSSASIAVRLAPAEAPPDAAWRPRSATASDSAS